MPKGRQEKFAFNRDVKGDVTLVRKDSDAGKKLASEKKEFRKVANKSDILKGSSQRYKDRISDSAANGFIGESTKMKANKTQVTPGLWKVITK